MKELFKTESLTNQGLNFMNAYVDSALGPEIKNLKNEAVAELQNLKSIRQNGKRTKFIYTLGSLCLR